MVDEAHGTGALGPDGRGAVAAAGLEDEVDVIVGHARQVARLLRRVRLLRAARMAKYLINSARTLIFSTALPPPAVAAAMAALGLLREQPRRVEKLQRNAPRAARGAGRRRALPCRTADTQILPADRGRRRGGGAGQRARPRARRVRPGDPAADGARRHLAAAARRDGLAHAVRAARGRRQRCAAAVRAGPRAPRSARGSSTACATPPSGHGPVRGLFVTGTDTGVGKSVLAASICAALAESGERWRPSSRRSRARTSRGGDWPADHELLAEAAGAGQEPEDVAPYASARRSRRTSPPSWPGRVDRAARLLERARAAAGSGAARLRGRRRPARAAHARLPRARPGGRPRPAGGGGRAAPALGTINHTLLTVEAARAVGPDGGRGGDDALAGEPRADRALQPRDGRAPRRRAGERPAAHRRPSALAEAGAALPLGDWLWTSLYAGPACRR